MNPGDTDTFLGFFALDWKEMVVMEETGRIKMASEPDSPPDSKHLPIQASKLPLLQQLINSYWAQSGERGRPVVKHKTVDIILWEYGKGEQNGAGKGQGGEI
jgi:hypothetical protein